MSKSSRECQKQREIASGNVRTKPEAETPMEIYFFGETDWFSWTETGKNPLPPSLAGSPIPSDVLPWNIGDLLDNNRPDVLRAEFLCKGIPEKLANQAWQAVMLRFMRPYLLLKGGWMMSRDAMGHNACIFTAFRARDGYMVRYLGGFQQDKPLNDLELNNKIHELLNPFSVTLYLSDNYNADSVFWKMSGMNMLKVS